MKRRAISFMTALVLCLGLCPTRVLAASSTLPTDMESKDPYPFEITGFYLLDTNGYTYTAAKASALKVTSTGELYLTSGTIESKAGAGIEVEAGGYLCVEEPEMTIIGMTYGLDIASGADVRLSAGTFIGGISAIQAENADYASLLDPGYAFFKDENGAPIELKDMSGEKKVVVKEHTDHKYSYTHVSGSPTHYGTCVYCGTKALAEPCVFTFNTDGVGACGICGRKIEIKITINNQGDLIYDGNIKDASVEVSVLLDGRIELDADKDYTVTSTPSVNAGVGIITVTVTGEITVNDKTSTWTFEKSYDITKDKPVITWDGPSVAVYYQADKAGLMREVTAELWNNVKIDKRSEEDLREFLQFSYVTTKDGKGQEVTDASSRDGLPTEAGTYQITARLPKMDNYEASDPSDPITLEIRRVSPFINGDVPKAATPTYRYQEAQKLVTSGSVQPGAVIEFALEDEDGSRNWSTEIPEAINAGNYTVWYKVDETNNYEEVAPTEIEGVKILRKPVTPDVTLDQYSFVYNNVEHQPGVTVMDITDNNRVLPTTEYKVTYTNNREVGPATVTVEDADGGNYQIVTPVTRTFTISKSNQDGLSITGQPDQVFYGSEFTLGTGGGSGNETVKWEITAGNTVARIEDPTSGHVKVIGLGSFTVKATKPGGNNLEEAFTTVTFDAQPKPVTAVVTAASKTYDGTNTAEVTAEVPEQDIVSSGDVITIEGLSGTFSDANAGTGKAVTVDKSAAVITIPKFGDNEKYVVTIPTTPVTADITKATASITAPTGNSRIYDGSEQDLLSTGASVSVATGVTVEAEYALSESGTYSTVIPKATDAGSYEVWYRVRQTANYTGPAAKSVTVTIERKTVAAYITLSPNPDPTVDSEGNETYDPFYYYDSSEKKPAVKVTYTETGEEGQSGTTEVTISPKEYDVTYKNNVNVGTVAGTNPPTVIVTPKENGNYTFDNTDGIVTETFTIVKGDNKAVLTSSPQARDLTYKNGVAQELVTVGTATGGHLEYALEDVNSDGSKSEPDEDAYTTDIPKKEDAGTYIVYYKVVGDGNHESSDVYSVSVTIKPKTITHPVISLDQTDQTEYTYDGTAKKPEVIKVEESDGTVIWKKEDGDSSAADEFFITYSNNINAGSEATVHIASRKDGNYNVNGSTTFEIKKAAIDLTGADVTKPTPRGNSMSSGRQDETALTYNGAEQELIVKGQLPHGKLVYSLEENGVYSETVPTASERKAYTIYYKVAADENHVGSAPEKLYVSIIQNKVTNPTITVSRDQFTYNGTQQKPDITVWDDDNLLIPETEYEVEIKGKDGVANSYSDVGEYSITIKTRGSEENANYIFVEPNNTKSDAYEILPADQVAVAITGMPAHVYYGDDIQLSLTGGTGEGEVVWDIERTDGVKTKNIFDEEPKGLLHINEVGDSYTITAKRTSTSGNYEEISTTYGPFPIKPKPVTAVITDANRTYENNLEIDLTEFVSVPGAEDIKFTTLKGTLNNVDVGVQIAEIPRNYEFTGNDDGNYKVTVPETATVRITPAAVDLTDKALPTAANPTYNESPQKLIKAGAALDGGVWVYSLDGVNYSQIIPEAVNARNDYTVWYKVLGDSNHNDTVPEQLTATIQKKQVDVKVTCSPDEFPYDEKEKTPYVIVTYAENGVGKVLPDSEYTVELPEERIEKRKYTVTVKAKEDGNYQFTGDAEGFFSIVPADQTSLTISTYVGSSVHYGDTFIVSASGGSGNGKIVWDIKDEKDANENGVTKGDIASIGLDGKVTVKGVGYFTVTAKREADERYGDSNEAVMTFKADRKPVTAVVTAGPAEMYYEKDRSLDIVLSASVPGTDIVISNIKGTLPDVNAGDKIVEIDLDSITDDNVQSTNNENDPKNYDISYPQTITVTIKPADVKVKATGAPVAETDHPKAMTPEYNGSLQELITLGEDLDGGFWAYSTNGSDYNRLIPSNVPTGKKAGTYPIWYKVIPDGNHKTDIAPADPLLVTIQQKEVAVEVECSPKEFTYNGDLKTPDVSVKDTAGNVISAGEYTVEYPMDRYTIGTHTVKITSKGNYEFTGNLEATFEIKPAPQSRLTIVYDQDPTVYFGDTFWVSASGGLAGKVVWDIEKEADTTEPIAKIESDSAMSERAKVSVVGVGSFTVTAYREEDGNYSQSEPATMTFTAKPKPVTAVVAPVELVYNKTRATGEEVNPSVSVPGTDIEITGIKGTLTDVNVGDKIVEIDPESAVVTSTTGKDNPENYDISYPETMTVTIKPADVTVETGAPVAEADYPKKSTWTYDGNPHDLVVPGRQLVGGVWAYSTDHVNYDQNVPQRTNAGEYKVWYKVIPDSNYQTDIAPADPLVVEVKKQVQSSFKIVEPSDPIHYGDQFTLNTEGGLGDGEITWESESNVVTVNRLTGHVEVKGVGKDVEITATIADSDNYKGDSYTWKFEAEKKPVTATVTAANKTYDGTMDAILQFNWTGLINSDMIDTHSVKGTFADADAGKDKTVIITGDITDTRYDVTIPEGERTTTATIYKANPEIETAPIAKTGLVYGDADFEKPLVSAGSTKDGINKVIYYLVLPKDKAGGTDGVFNEDDDVDEDLDTIFELGSPNIPTVKEVLKAGTYEVQYGVRGDKNWNPLGPKSVYVTIDEAGKSGAGEVDDDLDSINPGSSPSRAPSTSQTSSPSTDTSSGTDTTQSASKPGTGSVSMQTTVQDKTASTVLDSAAGNALVNEAVANKSANIVIKPEITGSVSKTEVSIPASAVSRIGSETDASLTVSTPVADVTIPNTSLSALSGAGGAVSVVTEQVDHTVVLTLSADGQDVGTVPGGLTLTVPSEDAGPGTVAVLIHEDGTREIIRKSVAEDGSVRIPLSGSATVEIVDNSKQFADVPAESWAADAVAFASAHEILNGTGEETFSPEISMSRAMLATVLYNLEGCPEQGLTGAFSDVSSDAWYAAGISWAAANGITSGYGDGQFGPNDNLTREQLAVMLWRYMESPAADKQVPAFTDTDQASSYAMEALYWATANGILNGYGNGQLDPSGSATRAQAAQMLKNFIENT